MKKYSVCFLLSACLLVVVAAVGTLSYIGNPKKETEIIETTQITESTPLDQAAANQVKIENRVEAKPIEEYYLVSEDGFLLVFYQDKSTICLYTHMPLTEFSQEEQEKLREGIWFPSMLDILNYLESHSS